MKKTTACPACGDPATLDEAIVRVKVLYGSRARHPSKLRFHILCWAEMLEAAHNQSKARRATEMFAQNRRSNSPSPSPSPRMESPAPSRKHRECEHDWRYTFYKKYLSRQCGICKSRQKRSHHSEGKAWKTASDED